MEQQFALVVEDNPKANELYSTWLTDLQFEVHSAHNVIDAKKYLGQNPYQLIVLDHFLEDGLSIDVLQHLKTLTPPLPYALICTIDLDHMIQDLRDNDIYPQGVLEKPFLSEEFYQAVQALLKGETYRPHRPGKAPALCDLLRQHLYPSTKTKPPSPFDEIRTLLDDFHPGQPEHTLSHTRHKILGIAKAFDLPNTDNIIHAYRNRYLTDTETFKHKLTTAVTLDERQSQKL